MSIRDTWNSTPDEKKTEPDGEPDGGAAPDGDSGLPKNVLLKILFIALAAVVWVVIGVGKVLFYGSGAVIFIAVSLLELALQLIVMPFALVLRIAGASRWPVQINRNSEHFATEYASDFAAAATLRDDVAGRLEHGFVPASESVDSK